VWDKEFIEPLDPDTIGIIRIIVDFHKNPKSNTINNLLNKCKNV